ncbi:MAG: FAD-dependent oxidoreductase, partial [FCB group bacterium]|nr:FAD-dependent oxidoreductase [FCB group bacterium]
MIRAVNQPDVVVVGAGPAGLSAAIRLARAGCAVTVCERFLFPRRKVCGGCLSGDAVELLRALLGAKALALGAPVSRITFRIGRRTVAAGAGERCRIVPRDILDATLAEAAEEAGATFRFGVAAELAEDGAGRFGVRFAGESSWPTWVLWAAGLNGPVGQDGRTSIDARHSRYRRRPGAV